MNTTSPYHLFRFDRLEFEMPYLRNIVTIEAPWSYALALGSSFLYLLLITTKEKKDDLFRLAKCIYMSSFNNETPAMK